jgi:hypothetical protein
LLEIKINYRPGQCGQIRGCGTAFGRSPNIRHGGTGRMADNITLGEKIIAIDITDKPDDILEFLKTRLIETAL